MTSKASRLAASASFSHAAPAVSARRSAIAAATQAPTAGAEQVRREELPLKLISHNPDNPREELGDLSDLTQTLREIGLVQAITVATIEAYLKDRPERASDLDEGAEYVVVDGHRRLAAAHEAGFDTIKYIVNDDFAASDEKLLEAAYVANAHRANMTELEEAAALEKLVGHYGSQRKAAQRLGVSQGFISQRLSLLSLDVSLQAELQQGTRNVEHVRGLGKLAPEEQRRKADERAAEARRADQNKGGKNSSVPAEGEQASDNAVITQPADPPHPAAEASAPARPDAPGSPAEHPPARRPLKINSTASSDASPLKQEPHSTQDVPTPRAELKPISNDIPWHDGRAVADLLIQHMAAKEVRQLTLRLIEHNSQSESEANA